MRHPVLLFLAVVSALAADRGPAPVRTAVYRGHNVTYQVINGRAIYQGDIDLGPANQMGQPSPKSSTVAVSSSLWPSVSGVAHVPYTLSAGTQSDAAAVGRINTAISTFNTIFAGIIQWVPRTSETNYAILNLNPSDHSRACEAVVGLSPGGQNMGGSIDCTVPVLLHEMGHTIGLWHEQSRLDRDAYVSVIYNNIDKPQFSNFDKVLNNEVDLGLYDYASVMHYSAFLFSKYGVTPTLESIPAGIPLSNQTGYSSGDIDAIKRLYGHAPTAVTIDTNPSGGQVIVDGVPVVTPQTFIWALNSNHTLDLPTDPQTIGGQLCQFARWTDAAGSTRSHTIAVLPGNGTPSSPSTSPAATVYTANFITLYQYALSPNTFDGTATVNPQPAVSFNGKNYYMNRQLVAMTAVPNAGKGFFEWANVALFNLFANPNTLYVQNDMSTVQPVFQPAPVLTVASNAPGFPQAVPSPSIAVRVDGNTTFTPANLSWTTGRALDGTPLNPSPVTGNITYVFANWSDGGAIQHVVNPPGDGANQTITANYTPSYRALVQTAPTCGGTVGPSGDQFLTDGTTLSYTATPAPEFQFVGWTQDLTGTTNPISTTIHDELLATANFNLIGTDEPISITSFTPPSTPPSPGAFDLVVHGTGFTNNTHAFWGSSLTFRQSTSWPTRRSCRRGPMAT